MHTNSSPSFSKDKYIDFQLFMTVNGRQFAIQPKFRVAKLTIMCVGTKFDCRDLPPFLAEKGKPVRILTIPSYLIN